MKLRQTALLVIVLVEIRQPEARLELAAELLLERMGELNAAVLLLELAHLLRIAQRVEGQGVDDALLVLVDDEIRADVIAAEQDAALFQDAEALAKDRNDLLDIAVRDRVEDQIEALVLKRKRFGHIGLDDAQFVALPGGDHRFAFQLAVGVIQDRADCACSGEDRHLLAAAACEAEQIFPAQVAEPRPRHGLRRRQQHRPVAGLCPLVCLAADRPAPDPALVNPAVDRFGIDVLIFHGSSSSLQQHTLSV